MKTVTIKGRNMKLAPLVAIGFLLTALLCYTVLKSVTPDTQSAGWLNNSDVEKEDKATAAANLHAMKHFNMRDHRNGQWLSYSATIGFEMYIYTAFYDDRKSLGTLPIVRVIVVAEEMPEPVIYCQFTFTKSSKVEYVRIMRTDIGAGVRRHDRTLKEYLFNCKMPHEEIPEKVGFVVHDTDRTDTVIPVELPDKPKLKLPFGMCVSISYWRHDPYQIVEWMELLKIMGVRKVTVYNNSLEHEAARVFLHYSRMGSIEFRQSHNFISDPGELTFHLHMSPVINDCMYRNMYKFKKIVVTDWDELIVPRTGRQYDDMINAIDQTQGTHNNHPAKHYMFRNNYFFLDIPGEDQSQSQHLVTMRHRKKVVVSEKGYATKSIIDPQACVAMHNHFCWMSTPLYDNEKVNVEVEPNLALSHHYKKCHLDIWERPGRCRELIYDAINDDVMLRYKSLLEEKMKPHLKRLGLAPLEK